MKYVLAQSNVDEIHDALAAPTKVHRLVEEWEWWRAELGERPAMDVATAVVCGSWFQSELAMWARSYRLGWAA